jgi:NAD(P)-dependent dehydrogenase (short-subunit alcohol dehydrogenase family)
MMTKALALNGASKVYIVGRRLEKLHEAAKESPHSNIIPLQGDVTSKESIESIAEHIRKETGYVNLLICNSGVSGPQAGVNMPKGTSAKEFQKLVLNSPMEDFTRTFAVNVSGVYYNAVAFLDLLEEGNKKGNLVGVKSHVLVTGSIAAYNRSVGAGIAYNTSKAAVTHLVKVLAGLFVEYSVRVNAIAPGSEYSELWDPVSGFRRCRKLTEIAVFPSELSAPLLAGKEPTKEGAFPKSFIPAEKTGDEQDMAGTILYMASRAGAYCNGLILVVDGGRLTLLPGSY